MTDSKEPSTQPDAGSQSSEGLDYFRTLFDALPSPVIIVDADVRIEDANTAGRKLLGSKETFYQSRGGEVLNCIHVPQAAAGCGQSAACADCIIRNSVAAAAAGNKVARMRTRMQLHQDGATSEVYLLVTASPFRYQGRALVLLQLEDISELVKLKSLLPICAWCKKIRNDDNYWHSVESYFKAQADVDFSHGICPECAARLDPELPDGKA